MNWRKLTGIVLSLTATASSAALLGRAPLTPGGTDYQAYYDTELNLTWLANANLAATNTYGVAGITSSGAMSWNTAIEWIAALNTAALLNLNYWRLPTVTDTSNPGCDFAYSGTDCGYNVDIATSEMAHLYYSTLGNLAAYDTSGAFPQPGSGLTSSGPFSSLVPTNYWSGTTYDLDSSKAWGFEFDNGGQTPNSKINGPLAWAIHDGDPLAIIPIPAAAWLLGSALGTLSLTRRRQSGGRLLSTKPLRAFLLALISFFSCEATLATPRTWTLFDAEVKEDHGYETGKSITGSFSYDPATNTYSNASVTSTSGACCLTLVSNESGYFAPPTPTTVTFIDQPMDPLPDSTRSVVFVSLAFSQALSSSGGSVALVNARAGVVRVYPDGSLELAGGFSFLGSGRVNASNTVVLDFDSTPESFGTHNTNFTIQGFRISPSASAVIGAHPFPRTSTNAMVWSGAPSNSQYLGAACPPAFASSCGAIYIDNFGSPFSLHYLKTARETMTIQSSKGGLLELHGSPSAVYDYSSVTPIQEIGFNGAEWQNIDWIILRQTSCEFDCPIVDDLTLSQPDFDGDGVADAQDNCILAANLTQLDSDGDGYGNKCDGDLNNSGLVTAADFTLLRSVLNQLPSFSALAAAADFNESGRVTATDFGIFRALLNAAPGPSGLHP